MIDAANYSTTETLRDGCTVEIRAQRSQDREGMRAAIAGSCSGSLHRRFFGVRRQFSEKETDYFLDIGFVNHVALVVVAGDPSQNGGGRSAAGCLEQDSRSARDHRPPSTYRRFSCAPRRGRRRHSYRGAVALSRRSLFQGGRRTNVSGTVVAARASYGERWRRHGTADSLTRLPLNPAFSVLDKGRAIRAEIRAAKAKLFFLPALLARSQPIEQAFAKMKTLLRKADARPVLEVRRPIVDAQKCQGNARRKTLKRGFRRWKLIDLRGERDSKFFDEKVGDKIGGALLPGNDLEGLRSNLTIGKI